MFHDKGWQWECQIPVYEIVIESKYQNKGIGAITPKEGSSTTMANDNMIIANARR